MQHDIRQWGMARSLPQYSDDPLEKKTNAVRCEDHRTISFLSHASKVMLKIINRRLQRKAEKYVSINQFGFRKGVGTREVIAIIRMISERSIE